AGLGDAGKPRLCHETFPDLPPRPERNDAGHDPETGKDREHHRLEEVELGKPALLDRSRLGGEHIREAPWPDAGYPHPFSWITHGTAGHFQPRVGANRRSPAEPTGEVSNAASEVEQPGGNGNRTFFLQPKPAAIGDDDVLDAKPFRTNQLQDD